MAHNEDMSTTSTKANEIRSEGLTITSQRPGVIAANDGQWVYRYEQTNKGWQCQHLGRMFS
jgi:hypothetical protein